VKATRIDCRPALAMAVLAVLAAWRLAIFHTQVNFASSKFALARPVAELLPILFVDNMGRMRSGQ
jgi:hypothetical protein